MASRRVSGIEFETGRWPLVPEFPTLVFIHGSGCDRSMWQGQVGGLLAAANTIAIDLPGHGTSKEPGCRSVQDYALRLTQFLDHLKPPFPVPCGLSVGGAVVLQMLLDSPSILAGGVLMGTGARLRVLPEIFALIDSDYPAFVDMIDRFSVSSKTDPERLKPVRKAMANCSPAVTHGDFKACDNFDVMDQLGRIQTPVLVISAEEDQLTPPKYSDYLEQQIAGSQRVHIREAGHLMPIEQPEAVNQALASFVAGLPYHASAR